ncbi:alpha/beta hydrolase family protein [Roseovarius sp. A-2]|uniref:alpha/beta hydrolase family protein n=1 Tax=Roseovarius sp. A-2 TaxID=1570360 RepID=UPI0009B581F5|nr:alpha/beta fold hydrolase [Roseovarius sp. A-2]GAW37305.1 alpha/beta hydrolase family protein [Roseovarius sp. A-2]
MKTEVISRRYFWSSKAKQISLVSDVDLPHADFLLFHGGGWVRGSPDMLSWLAPPLEKSGVRLILPSYRLLGQDGASVDDAISDTLAATKWFIRRRDRAKRLFVGGASSGGLLALHALKKWPDAFSGVILMNPVTNTGENGFRNRQIGAEGRTDISPLAFARDLPRTRALIIHPGEDVVVPIAQSEDFLQSWNNPDAKLRKWPERGGHGSFGRPNAQLKTQEIICEFILTLETRPVSKF